MRGSFWRALCRLAPALALIAGAGAAGAVEVYYEAYDLADQSPGTDLRRYHYRIDAFPYEVGYGLTIFFAPALYGALADPPSAPGGGWDAIVVQPDPFLDDGLYDAEALVDHPVVETLFVVDFEWLGTGRPAEQPFAVRDPSLFVVEAGITAAPEPEADARRVAALVGLAALAAGRHVRGAGASPC